VVQRARTLVDRQLAQDRARQLTTRRYLPILVDVARRRSGTLLPLEEQILETALALRRGGVPAFHGFGIAQVMRERARSRSLTAHGTLYKALTRLEEFGLLRSSWEDANSVEGRPRRRLYELTGEGVHRAEQVAASRVRVAAGAPAVLPEPA
jgi:PadR family transcriptional regulator, regulatory protein PadR